MSFFLNEYYFEIKIDVSGERGLEVRCDGVGQIVFMDIHTGSFSRNSWHNFASPIPLRR